MVEEIEGVVETRSSRQQVVVENEFVLFSIDSNMVILCTLLVA